MESTKSKSGRTHRPTKRYQSYCDESTGVVNRKKKAKKDTTNGNLATNDCTNTNNHLGNSAMLTSSTLETDGRKYVCRHCNISVFCGSAQEFIKIHHMHEDNTQCYDKGLVHCPNKDCKKKVFLTEKDLERHVFMRSSSKNICLQWYRDAKAQASLMTQHATTQVEFPPLSMSGKKDMVNRYGTLLNDGNNLMISIQSSHDINRHQELPSRLHLHNVLLAQGNTYISLNRDMEDIGKLLLSKDIISFQPVYEYNNSSGIVQQQSSFSCEMDERCHRMAPPSSQM